MQAIKWPLELSKELTIVNAEFKKLIESFSDNQFFKSPKTDMWSAAEIAEHVILSDHEMYKSVTGRTSETERAPDLYTDQLKAVFLNFDSKMKSPDFIIPKGKFKTKHATLKAFDEVVMKLQDAANNLDLSKTCEEIVVQEFKGSTRLEVLYFTVVHTQRHAHQMNKLAAIINT